MKLVSIIAATAALWLPFAAADSEFVYLVNGSKGSDFASGMAYYTGSNLPSGTGSNVQPIDYTAVADSSNIQWEGTTVDGFFSDSGVSFTVTINGNAASQSTNMPVGTGTNGFVNFTCYQAAGPGSLKPLLYTTPDGWAFFSIYWCIASS